MMYMRQSEIPDFKYMKLVLDAWSQPEWPSSIKLFLKSMGSKISLTTRNKSIPDYPPTWSTSELKPVKDIDGNPLGGPFNNPSRFDPLDIIHSEA